MRKFESIYVDIETGEILNINKSNKKNYETKKLSEKWKREGTDWKLTTIYSAKQIIGQTSIEW